MLQPDCNRLRERAVRERARGRPGHSAEPAGPGADVAQVKVIDPEKRLKRSPNTIDRSVMRRTSPVLFLYAHDPSRIGQVFRISGVTSTPYAIGLL